jgi:alkanesulfonate monooxygenase SsuD/methylene tetrahydromethanopterin reductase-like flavin-dependent oxidoreductase (luciferase family)
MPDYGHKLEFGYFLTPEAADTAGVLATARLLDALGYDFIGIQDHPYQPRFLDARALLAYVLAQTERVRVFPAVANLALRPPALLAKEAASRDRLSGGRFALALGIGGFQQAAAAMGGAVHSPGEQMAALVEAIEIIRAMWSGARGVRYAGSYYQLDGLHAGPPPAHDVGIWIGASGPRARAPSRSLGAPRTGESAR